MKLQISTSAGDSQLRTLLRQYRAFVIDRGGKFIKVGIESVPANFVQHLKGLNFLKHTLRGGIDKFVFSTGSYVEVTSGKHSIVTAYLTKQLSISRVAADIDKPRQPLSIVLKSFIKDCGDAKYALNDKEAAWNSRSSLPRDLVTHLRKEGFSAVLILGVGFKKTFVKACSSVMKQLHDFGPEAAKTLVHSAVRVDNIVIDLTHLCLGEQYLQRDNCTFSEFGHYWSKIRVIKHS